MMNIGHCIRRLKPIAEPLLKILFYSYRLHAWSSIVCSAFTHRPRKPDLSLGLWRRTLAIICPHLGCLLQEIKNCNKYRFIHVRFGKPTNDSVFVKWRKTNGRQSPVAVGWGQEAIQSSKIVQETGRSTFYNLIFIFSTARLLHSF